MNLELSTRDYLTLLKGLYLADCVANGHADITGREHRDISRLRRKVFSYAKEEGFGDLVRHDEGQDDYVETELLAEEMDAEYMDRHIDLVFWRELASRFAEKIMDQRFGAEMTGWSDAEYKRHREVIEKKIEAEIQAGGLSKFFLLGDFSS
jgi:hypothetical protein